MNANFTLVLILVATAVDGFLAGASLDQSIKQLPARHKIGVIAYSQYSRAADLGNGILWYSLLGVGALLLTMAAGVAAYVKRVPKAVALPLYISGGLAILHTIATSQAAPTNFKQRQVSDDEKTLKKIFDEFSKWQTIRCVLQVAVFGMMLWGLVAYAKS
jgi:hypothetical protein